MSRRRPAGPKLPRADLPRLIFSVLSIAALLVASLWVALPFLGALVWAAMVVVASWPLMLRVQNLLWGRRSLAVAVMTLLLLLLFVVPLVLAIVTIADNAERLGEWGRIATTYHLPDTPPRWLADLPLVGSWIASAWERAADLGLRDLLPRLQPYAGSLTRWFVAQAGSVGFVLVQFFVIVLIAGVLYATGEEAADFMRRFARRLGGERGDSVVLLAGGAIRGVALGVGLTALVQSLLGGLALAVAGVPFAGLLTALMFMLCIAQIGPLPVLAGAVAWAFWTDSTGWGIFLLVVAAAVGTIDNVLRPMFIRMGADLPFLLIFAGVIGGLLSFGLVGIFVGPVVLAVSWTLLEAWVGDGEAEGVEAPPAGKDWRD